MIYFFEIACSKDSNLDLFFRLQATLLVQIPTLPSKFSLPWTSYACFSILAGSVGEIPWAREFVLRGRSKLANRNLLEIDHKGNKHRQFGTNNHITCNASSPVRFLCLGAIHQQHRGHPKRLLWMIPIRTVMICMQRIQWAKVLGWCLHGRKIIECGTWRILKEFHTGTAKSQESRNKKCNTCKRW